MFIGYYAVALAAKKAAPRTSLGVQMFAAQFLDLLWPIFLLAGLEHVHIAPGITAFTPLDFTDYPISHSLLTVVGWSALVGGIFFAFVKRGRDAILVGSVVLSHWVLDWVTHRPDLPLWPGASPKAGLGLWNHPAATLAVESARFAIGIWLYLRMTKARDGVGRWGLAITLVLVVALYLAAAFGPPPPSEPVLAFSALGAWMCRRSSAGSIATGQPDVNDATEGTASSEAPGGLARGWWPEGGRGPPRRRVPALVTSAVASAVGAAAVPAGHQRPPAALPHRPLRGRARAGEPVEVAPDAPSARQGKLRSSKTPAASPATLPR